MVEKPEKPAQAKSDSSVLKRKAGDDSSAHRKAVGGPGYHVASSSTIGDQPDVDVDMDFIEVSDHGRPQKRLKTEEEVPIHPYHPMHQFFRHRMEPISKACKSMTIALRNVEMELAMMNSYLACDYNITAARFPDVPPP